MQQFQLLGSDAIPRRCSAVMALVSRDFVQCHHSSVLARTPAGLVRVLATARPHQAIDPRQWLCTIGRSLVDRPDDLSLLPSSPGAGLVSAMVGVVSVLCNTEKGQNRPSDWRTCHSKTGPQEPPRSCREDCFRTSSEALHHARSYLQLSIVAACIDRKCVSTVLAYAFTWGSTPWYHSL